MKFRIPSVNILDNLDSSSCDIAGETFSLGESVLAVGEDATLVTALEEAHGLAFFPPYV